MLNSVKSMIRENSEAQAAFEAASPPASLQTEAEAAVTEFVVLQAKQPTGGTGPQFRVRVAAPLIIRFKPDPCVGFLTWIIW